MGNQISVRWNRNEKPLGEDPKACVLPAKAKTGRSLYDQKYRDTVRLQRSTSKT